MSRTTPLCRAALLGLLLTVPAVGAAPAFADTSHTVAVVRGFTPPHYHVDDQKTHLPDFPNPASGYVMTYPGVYDLSQYTYKELPFGSVNDASLAGVDTVVLYGVRWDDPRLASDRPALAAFAQTHKLLIWDADSTVEAGQPNSFGPPFPYPFSEYASGEQHGARGETTWPTTGGSALASQAQTGDYDNYIDANALADMSHAIGDASVISEHDPAGWQVGMWATNNTLEAHGPLPVLAWHYGNDGNHTGAIIYSGLDADAFKNTPPAGTTCTHTKADETAAPSCVNWVLKALAIQLAMPFSTTPDATCAPSCAPLSSGTQSPTAAGPGANQQSSSTTSSSSSTSSTSSTSSSTTTAAPTTTVTATCGLAAAVPTRWVHGTVTLRVRENVSGASALALSTVRGLSVASAPARLGTVSVKVNTKRLPSNRTSYLVASVLAGTTRACSVSFRLRVDNTPARVLKFGLRRVRAARLVAFRPSEPAKVQLVVKGRKTRTFHLSGARRVTITVARTKRAAKLVLIDRAGNVTTRVLKLA